MKRIFAAVPQDYVSWLLPGARFIGKASLELKTLTRTISTDALYKAILDDEQVILHVEFQWLRRRIGMLDDIIRETWFYQDIYEEGKEESMQEFRLAVLDVIQEHFPEIIELAKTQIEPIKDSIVLRRLIVKMSAAQTADKAGQYIEELGKETA